EKTICSGKAGIIGVITLLLLSVIAFYFYHTRLGNQPVTEPVNQLQASADFSDPNIPLLSGTFVDDSGYDLAYGHSTPIPDRRNLDACYASAEDRFRNATSDYIAQLDLLNRQKFTSREFQFQRAMLQLRLGLIHMYVGQFLEADKLFVSAVDENPLIARELKSNLIGLRGVAALRRGELDNCVACVGPSSCIFPIASEARHEFRNGSEKAVEYFRQYLSARPNDDGIKWLLQVAESTVGQSSSSIVLEKEWFPQLFEKNQFKNHLQELGLGTRGPNMLGGSVIGDFNNDHLPDIAISSGDWNLGVSVYIQQDDGNFHDVAEKSSLQNQKMAANLTAADYDNDGDLDILLLRGGWESPFRMTLLQNQGNAEFIDATTDSGLDTPIASQSAAWADFDLDGDLDIYVAGEYHDRNATPINCNRLYENDGKGHFTDIAEKAGVLNQGWSKGVIWGDYNNDGKPDIFVSNMNGFNRLYRNNGDKTFTDVASEAGVIEPIKSFSCWFFDFDDDGFQDLFVAGFSSTLNEIASEMSGASKGKPEFPRLFRNTGKGTFEDVTKAAGLDIATVPMGSNFGDYDNDGHLDFYLATGRPSYSMLVPNLMFRNTDGLHFNNATVKTGTGHLQKGHGVSFGDTDLDGDLDLFVQTGGQSPADKSHNVMFVNEMKSTNAIELHLVGSQSHRSAIGAKIKATCKGTDGKLRTLFRTIGLGSSFGGNSLTVHLGMSDAEQIDSLEIQWPLGLVQKFSQLKTNQLLEIKEGEAQWKLIRNLR
ncbi:MAG: FG-GAP-like repeat-containing protein, partial [bacterium]